VGCHWSPDKLGGNVYGSSTFQGLSYPQRFFGGSNGLSYSFYSLLDLCFRNCLCL